MNCKGETKVKCKVCNQEFTIPRGTCPICFSDVLGRLSDIEDIDERFDKLNNFIQNLTAYDYERGLHNAKCKNQLDEIAGSSFDWKEVE